MGAPVKFTIPDGTPEARCRGCSASIFWIETVTGKRMPVDRDGTSHFATCPDHARFRRGGAK